jgi:hypothetical protein
VRYCRQGDKARGTDKGNKRSGIFSMFSDAYLNILTPKNIFIDTENRLLVI